jgi:hypothetical protein
VAGVGTAVVITAVPLFARVFGAQSAFVRMVSVSLVFFALYFGGVIVLHWGLKPINETISLLRELLPERTVGDAIPAAVDS